MKKIYRNSEIKRETVWDNSPENTSNSSEFFFDLQELEMAFLMERKQAQDYKFFYRLSIAGFYLSLLLFVWHVAVG